MVMVTRINADFSQRVVIRPADYHWVTSPMAGVERMMLDRIGDESARATSIVRYAPFSEFPAHTHIGGEEFLVLDGVFADEHQSYPKGSYVRNPIGTAHTPKIGAEGAVIFVKLQQFQAADQTQKVIYTQQQRWQQELVAGVNVMLLHEFSGEHVALVKWEPNRKLTFHQPVAGAEILVLEGSLYDEQGIYPQGSWLRAPDLNQQCFYSKDDGALIYLKTGHFKDEFRTLEF